MKSSMTARVTSVSMLISALLMVAGPANAQHNMDGMGRHASDDEACQPQLMQGHGKHLAQMKNKLHLTTAQTPAWEAFSKTINTMPERMGDMRESSVMEKMTTPERLEKMGAMHEVHMTAMQSHMKERHEAVLTFYNQLNPDQQKIFDAQSWSFHKRHPMH